MAMNDNPNLSKNDGKFFCHLKQQRKNENDSNQISHTTKDFNFPNELIPHLNFQYPPSASQETHSIFLHW